MVPSNNTSTQIKFILNDFGGIPLAETKATFFLQRFPKMSQFKIFLFCTTETCTSHLSFVRSNNSTDLLTSFQ